MAGFPFTYAVTAAEVQVRLGRWVCRRVALTDIERADVRALGRVPWWNEHWSNFSPAFGPWVVLRRRSGWFRNFVFNPPDPQGFLDELRRQAPQLGQA